MPGIDWVIMKKSIEFLKGFLDKVNEEDSIAYAYQLTYGLLLSIFPFLIFVLTLIAYLGLDRSYVLNLLRTSLPEEIYGLVSGPVVDLVENQRGGLLSLSVLGAVYAASGGFRAFMKGMNQSMGFKDTRSFIYRYIISILWVLQLAVTILLALLGIVFGRQILDFVSSNFPFIPTEGIVEILRIVIPVGLLFGVLSLAYMFIPYRNVKFKYAFPGAIFSTLVWIAFTILFQFYINNFANYSRFYGTLGAVIGLLLWLSLTSIIMMLGASLNAYLIERREIEDPYMKKRKRKNGTGREEKEKEKEDEDSGNRSPEDSKSVPEKKFETLKKRVEETFKDSGRS